MTAPAPASVPGALRALLEGLVDYAGLFPPAALDMDAAVARFAAYQAGGDRWMLGRFVVPATRLDEFACAAAGVARRPRAARWRLSVLVGPDTEADLARVEQFNEAGSTSVGAVVDTVEAKAAAAAGIARLGAAVPRGLATYVELPVAADPAPLVNAVRAARLRAKVRTGGITPDAFPEPAEIVRFVEACRAARVAFKATAGLHHPLRGDYRLTYAPDSACGAMFGFVNVFLAALLLRDGLPARDAERLLAERDPSAFSFDDEAARWRDHAVPAARVREGRAQFATAFGSCSFEEPVAELRALGWMA